jgi:hypothetical protein
VSSLQRRTVSGPTNADGVRTDNRGDGDRADNPGGVV